jgi:2-polyprenyl-3-methyl-5-hydroxy-6-metoxy-1,4-benzoquinol methylase
MSDITWTHPALPRILDSIPLHARSLVDIGCGRGIVGALCRIYRKITRLVGVDGYQPSLEFCRFHHFYDELVERNIGEFPLVFRDKEFEVATCIEVIEHLPREEGLQLLDELERISSVVIVTTPNEFFHQPEYDENPYQKHLSSWTVGDFRRRGYDVQGIGGLKIFGRSRRVVSTALGPITRVVPRLSSAILCIKQSDLPH